MCYKPPNTKMWALRNAGVGVAPSPQVQIFDSPGDLSGIGELKVWNLHNTQVSSSRYWLLRDSVTWISPSFVQMVSAFLIGLFPVLFPKCRFNLMRQVPSNSELFKPQAALNESFLNKSTHIQYATKTQERTKQLQSSCWRNKILLPILGLNLF